jgi:hypothetical protein
VTSNQPAVTMFDIVGKVHKQTFKAKQVPFSTAPLLYLDDKLDISAGQYMRYLNDVIAAFERKGMTDRAELLINLKRETYFIGTNPDEPHVGFEDFAIAAQYSAANPGTDPIRCLAFGIGFVEGREEQGAKLYAGFSNADLHKSGNSNELDAKTRRDIRNELDRRERVAKSTGRPFLRQDSAAPSPATQERTSTVSTTTTMPPVRTSAAAPDPNDRDACKRAAVAEWATGTVNRDDWMSEAVFVTARTAQLMGLANVSRSTSDASPTSPAPASSTRPAAAPATSKPSAQPVATPGGKDAVRAKAEAEWDAGAVDKSAWASRAVYVTAMIHSPPPR